MANKTERLLEVTRRFLEVNPDAQLIVAVGDPIAAIHQYQHRFGVVEHELARGVGYHYDGLGISITAVPGDIE